MWPRRACRVAWPRRRRLAPPRWEGQAASLPPSAAVGPPTVNAPLQLKLHSPDASSRARSAALAEAALALRRSEASVGGRMVRLRPLSKPAMMASPAPPPTAAATVSPPPVDCSPSFAVDLVADMPSSVLGVSSLVPCAQAPAAPCSLENVIVNQMCPPCCTETVCLWSYRKKFLRRLHARLVLATTIVLSRLQLLQPAVALRMGCCVTLLC
jgi:hypothetical protein